MVLASCPSRCRRPRARGEAGSAPSQPRQEASVLTQTSGRSTGRRWTQSGISIEHVEKHSFFIGLGPRAEDVVRDRSLVPLRREIRIGRVLARLTYDLPRLRRWVFRIHGQALAEGMTDVLMGDRTYASLLSRVKTYAFLLGLKRS